MNQAPTPVPLDKLQALLNKSKAIMHKADKLKPMANSSINESYDDDVDSQELYEGSAVDYATTVSNSKLPDAIKKLMLDRPIARPDQIPVTPISENYSEDDEKEMPEMQRRRPQPAPQTRQRILTENTNSGTNMITISETQLDKIINEKLLNFFKNSYDKALTEAAINRTIKTMISEGVITSKKK